MRPAFTVLETLIVIGVITLVIVGSGYGGMESLRTIRSRDDASRLLSVARSARIAAMHGTCASVPCTLAEGSGLRIENAHLVWFRGTSYAGRDSRHDVSYPLSTNAATASLREVIFYPYSGTPATPGDFKLTNGKDGTWVVSISAAGTMTLEHEK